MVLALALPLFLLGALECAHAEADESKSCQDRQLVPEHSERSYRLRESRWEGYYERFKSHDESTLLVPVSLFQGDVQSYRTAPDSIHLTFLCTPSKSRTIHVRSSPLSGHPYYQMDACIADSLTYTWPTSFASRSGISVSDLGLIAWRRDSEHLSLVAVTTHALQGAQQRRVMRLRATSRLQELLVRKIARDQPSSKWVIVKRNVHVDDLVIVDLGVGGQQIAALEFRALDPKGNWKPLQTLFLAD